MKFIKLNEILFDVVLFLIISKFISTNTISSLIYDGGLFGKGMGVFLTTSVVAGCSFLLYSKLLLINLKFKGRKLFYFLLISLVGFISIYNFIYVFGDLNTLEFGISKENLYRSTIETHLVLLSVTVGLVIFSLLLVFLVSILTSDASHDAEMDIVFDSILTNDKWLLTGEKMLFLILFIFTPLIFTLYSSVFVIPLYVVPQMCVSYLEKITGNETIALLGWFSVALFVLVIVVIFKYIRFKKLSSLKKMSLFNTDRLRINRMYLARVANGIFNFTKVIFINFYFEFLFNEFKELNWKVFLLSGVLPARLYLFLTPTVKLSGVISFVLFLLSLLFFSGQF